MRNVLIFGGLAIVGYALYNKFYKKDNEVAPNIPTAPTGTDLMGDIAPIKPSVIESAVIRKKGKFTPNRPIGRPRKSTIDLPKGSCQCITTPCNC